MNTSNRIQLRDRVPDDGNVAADNSPGPCEGAEITRLYRILQLAKESKS